MNNCILIISVVILAGLLGCHAAGRLPSPETLSKWNFMLERELTHLANSVTQVNFITNEYQKDGRRVKLQEVKGMDMLKQTLQRMRQMLEKKEAALQRLVNAAEKAIAVYEDDPQLSLNQVPFLNMKEVKKNDDRLHFSSHFLQNVTFNESGVHIPLEIYEGCKWIVWCSQLPLD